MFLTTKKSAVSRRFSLSLALLVVLASFWGVVANNGTARAASLDANYSHGNKAVYSLTNDATGNAVAVYSRANDGSLTRTAFIFTGGNGSGSGLGSQGALVKDGKWLFAVNAGSNSISALELDSYGGLQLKSTIASGGTNPISLTAHDDVVYVLNAGGSGNISGFRLHEDGQLSSIANSTRPLSGTANAAPVEVRISPNGKVLVVTEKAANKLDTYTVDENGTPSQPQIFASSGKTPFGFSFDGSHRIIVSEAFGGAANASAVSSYSVTNDGKLTVESASTPTNQTAACWLVVSPNGKFTYSANAGSDSLSGFSVAADGKLTLLNSDGRTGVVGTGSHPIDEAISADGHFLYVLDSNVGKISAFSIASNGQLTALQDFGGLPLSSGGLVAE